jgi:adenylyl- and sulfurtransferase ThiI
VESVPQIGTQARHETATLAANQRQVDMLRSILLSAYSAPSIPSVERTSNGVRAKPDEPDDTLKCIRRAKREAALNRVFGIWTARADEPEDSVEYQRQIRAEWR